MNQTLRVLHLDDDPFALERFKHVLETEALGVKYQVSSALSVEQFRSRLSARPTPDIVVLDVMLDKETETGATLVQETRRSVPGAVVIMCSSLDTVQMIGDCLERGADDFLSKRSDKGELCLRIFNSYRLAKLKRGDHAAAPPEPGRRAPKVAGATFEKISKRLPLVIGSAITAVHIEGESGTGKEVVSDLLANHLPAATPFVKVNCGAIAPTLLESELFGHVKGSFTGAAGDKRGLIEAASGGWIFLDEVASLSPSAQVALLRALENHEVTRVGSTEPIRVHIRVISATNEPLEELVKKGKFRKDLWQRLCEAEIRLPPLRDRAEEIPELVRLFCQTMPGGPYRISEPTLDVLAKAPWRNGNVRELRNCLRAMTELHLDKLLTPQAVPERIWKQMKETPAPTAEASEDDIVIKVDTENPVEFDVLADTLLIELTRKLQRRHGKLSLRKLSKTIGISRSTLSGRMKTLVQRNAPGSNEFSFLAEDTEA